MFIIVGNPVPYITNSRIQQRNWKLFCTIFYSIGIFNNNFQSLGSVFLTLFLFAKIFIRLDLIDTDTHHTLLLAVPYLFHPMSLLCCDVGFWWNWSPKWLRWEWTKQSWAASGIYGHSMYRYGTLCIIYALVNWILINFVAFFSPPREKWVLGSSVPPGSGSDSVCTVSDPFTSKNIFF